MSSPGPSISNGPKRLINDTNASIDLEKEPNTSKIVPIAHITSSDIPKTEQKTEQNLEIPTVAEPPKRRVISQLCNSVNGFHHVRTANVNFVFDSNDDEEHLVPVHKSILAMHSPVFRQMFFGYLKECRDVKLTDTTIEAFVDFLKCFYNTMVIIDGSPLRISQIVYLAHKYDVEWLEEKCKEILYRMIDRELENVFWVQPLATFFGYDKLRQKCVDKLRLYGDSLIEDEFQESHKEMLKQMFGNIDFNYPDDVEELAVYIESIKAEMEPKMSKTLNKIRSKPITFVPPWVCDNLLLRTLLDDPGTADVVFVFEDVVNEVNPKPVRVSAHKCILASESEVFAERFDNFRDADETTINISGTFVDEFRIFLQLIYTIYPCEKMMALKEIDEQKIDAILSLATEFKVSSVIFAFEMHLVGMLNAENAIWLFELSTKHSLKSLRTESIRYLKENRARVLASGALLKCNQDTLEHLMELDLWKNY